MVTLVEHYKDVIATPTERLTIKSFRVPSKDGDNIDTECGSQTMVEIDSLTIKKTTNGHGNNH